MKCNLFSYFLVRGIEIVYVYIALQIFLQILIYVYISYK